MAPPVHRPQGLPALVVAVTTGSLLALGAAIGPAGANANVESPGSKGAQVYCFMRNNGNDHPVSWLAAYALIKRQSASMFKTSPEHAAVMITESVVQNPGTYPDCGRYLGDLYKRSPGTPTAVEVKPVQGTPGGTASAGGMTRGEQYGY
jgi:hypothetical protein